MAFVAAFICLLMAVVGGLGVFSPPRLLDIVRKFQSRKGLYFAGAIRVVLGVAFLLAAPGSRAPETFWFLGLVLIILGIITPLIGVDRFKRMLDRWASLGAFFIRAWGFVAMALGLLGAWAVLPVGG